MWKMFLVIELLETPGLTRRIDQDVAFQRAQEEGASTVGIVSTKQALRDATDLANVTIDTVGVTSVTNQLKASWDTSLLGDNPW